MLQGQDSTTFCMDLVRKCCDALKSGDGAQVPLLRTARELLRALPTGDKNKVNQSRACSGIASCSCIGTTACQHRYPAVAGLLCHLLPGQSKGLHLV